MQVGNFIFRRIGTFASVVTATLWMAGCMPFQAPRHASTSPQPTMNLPPREHAQQLMDKFGISLPKHAQNVRVVTPPLDDFRAKALISFDAPRDEVVDETCRGVKTKSLEHWPLIAGTIDQEILDYTHVAPDETKYGSCHQYIEGKNILVLVPRIEHITAYVVLYHMPYR